MLNSRIYGVLGIKSLMSNWNADFTGFPKSISTGEVFGSDKALKYPMKRMWEEQKEKVIYLKSFKTEEVKKKGEPDAIKVRPKSLKERYEEIFDVKNLKDERDSKKVLKNLFTAIDIKNFGATFAEEGNNLSITGAVQITQGFNKYEGHNVEEQQILSPFRDSTKDDAEQSTLGTKIVSNEAHYFYGFAINPTVYHNFIEMGVTEGYTQEDYEKFKSASLIAATAYNTNAKVGCENEFGLFVETEPELYFPDLAQYITYEKDAGEKGVINLGMADLFNDFGSRIQTIEIYYNPYTTILKGELNKANIFNIFTKEEV
ncbi:type I CRISPR-associated protein Cas7 [Acetobacterium tundrae]|uniref:CRISPR-associated protein n=1 Tax=Acetobacterium tundrae TaxID=132932 RepID=A0ABR6WP30_9FIRM|nr:type I CRISPR-associated protein Cas7 [Acetobacterium tundrae]MBC3798258.1 CRISPR-associated protein [Acetobacterium tundrae]